MADPKQPTTPGFLDWLQLQLARGAGQPQAQPMPTGPAFNPFSLEDWLLRMAATRTMGQPPAQGGTGTVQGVPFNRGQARQLQQLEDMGDL